MDNLSSGHYIFVDWHFEQSVQRRLSMACPQSTSRKALRVFVKAEVDLLKNAVIDLSVSLLRTLLWGSSGFERRIRFKFETVGRRGGWFCNKDKDCIPDGGIGRRFDHLCEKRDSRLNINSMWAKLGEEESKIAGEGTIAMAGSKDTSCRKRLEGREQTKDVALRFFIC